MTNPPFVVLCCFFLVLEAPSNCLADLQSSQFLAPTPGHGPQSQQRFSRNPSQLEWFSWEVRTPFPQSHHVPLSALDCSCVQNLWHLIGHDGRWHKMISLSWFDLIRILEYLPNMVPVICSYKLGTPHFGRQLALCEDLLNKKNVVAIFITWTKTQSLALSRAPINL